MIRPLPAVEALVRERRPAWDLLDVVVTRAMRHGPKRLGGLGVDELVRLYPAVAADLARLRALDADDAVIRHVNRILTRAHAQIYRSPRRRASIIQFFTTTYPRLVRAKWRYVLASFLISAVVATMAHFAVQRHPDVVSDVLGGADVELQGGHERGQFEQRFHELPSPVLSSLVTTNNIRVAFDAFALGVTFGVGTVYMLTVNGAMLGGFSGAYAESGLGGEFWTTVLPHGALELSAIVIAGGAGLMIGFGMTCPGRRSRLRALREESIAAVKIAAGLVPAFIVAGTFEGFLTPSDRIAPTAKAAIGIATALVFWFYLLAAGRTRTSRS